MTQKELDLIELQRQLAFRLTADLTVEAIANLGLQAAIQAGDMDCGGVYLIGDDPHSLLLKTYLGVSEAYVKSISPVFPGTDRWKLVMEGKPVFSNFDQLPFKQNSELAAEGLKSVAILPMIYQDDVIGSFQIASHNEKFISESQKKVLETMVFMFARHIGRAWQLDKALKNELQLRDLIESFDKTVLVISYDGQICYANQYLLEILGYNQQQFFGHNLEIFHNPNSDKKFSEILDELQNFPGQEQQILLVNHVGELLSLELSAKPGMWDFKPALFICGFENNAKLQDVTVENATDIRYLFDLIPAATLIINTQTFEILHSNHGFQKLFQYSSEVLTNFNFLQFFAQHEYMRLVTALRKRGLTGLVDNQTWAQVKRDGSEIQTILHIHPIEWGKVPASLVIIEQPGFLEAQRHTINENRYRDVVEQQVDAVVRYTPEGMITFVNHAYCDFLKRTPEQIIGRVLYEFIPLSEVEILKSHLGMISIEMPVVETHNYLIDGNGNWRFFNWIDRGIFENGKLIEIQGAGRDVTEQVKETLLQETFQQHYQTLLEELPGIVYILHAETLRPLYISPLFERMTGYNINDLLEQPGLLRKCIHPDDFDTLRQAISNRKAGEDLSLLEFRFFHKDGHIIWAQEFGSRIQTQAGVNILQGFILDVTETQLANQRKEFYSKFERLANNISLSLMKVKPEQWNDTVNEILGSIGMLLEVDRSYIFCLDEDQKTISNTHEWCAEGISPQISNLQRLPVKEVEIWHQHFNEENQFLFADIQSIQNKFDCLRHILNDESMQSFLLVPMMRLDKICGFIGFDSIRQKKEWDDQAILPLRMISQLLLNTKDRISPQKPLLHEI